VDLQTLKEVDQSDCRRRLYGLGQTIQSGFRKVYYSAADSICCMFFSWNHFHEGLYDVGKLVWNNRNIQLQAAILTCLEGPEIPNAIFTKFSEFTEQRGNKEQLKSRWKENSRKK
jgi:hypothetical protein